MWHAASRMHQCHDAGFRGVNIGKTGANRSEAQRLEVTLRDRARTDQHLPFDWSHCGERAKNPHRLLCLCWSFFGVRSSTSSQASPYLTFCLTLLPPHPTHALHRIPKQASTRFAQSPLFSFSFPLALLPLLPILHSLPQPTLSPCAGLPPRCSSALALS